MSKRLHKKETALCRRCLEPFIYVRRGKRGRDSCDKCLSAARRNASRAWKQGHFLPKTQTVGLSTKSCTRVGRALKLTPHQIRDIERAALLKIKETHPDLLAVYQQWVAEGSPRPEQRQDPGTVLLAHQMEVANWWGLYGDLMADGQTREADELLNEIEKCQALIGRELKGAHA